MKQYPVFVYGTLRKGFGNYQNYLRGLIFKEESGKTKGIMYDTGFFPAVIEGNNEIAGEIMYITPEFYKPTLTSLDSLEGYSPNSDFSMYTRKLVKVQNSGGKKVLSWIYIWNLSTNKYAVICHGDWKRWLEEKYR